MRRVTAVLAAGLVFIIAPAAVAVPAPPSAAPGGEVVVPYEPTPDVVVRAMLDIADVGKADVVMDLGSGDGRIVITAAKDYGARGIGVELDPALVALSRMNARHAGVTERVEFRLEDIFRTDLSPASVITMFLYREINLQLRPTLLDLRPGTRLVSHFHDMGEWRPDRSVLVKSQTHYGESWVRYWVVPAKVAGVWRWRERRAGEVQDHRLTLRQSFQEIEGELATESFRPFDIRDPKIDGAELAFWVPIREGGRTMRWDYRGRVVGDRIVGTAESFDSSGRKTVGWEAARAVR